MHAPHHAPGPKLLAVLLLRCWLCCCLSGVTFARGVGLRWRQFLLGHRSPTGPISTTPSTSVRVRCPWGMYALKKASTTRGHVMGSGATLPQLRARKSGIYPTFDSAAGLG